LPSAVVVLAYAVTLPTIPDFVSSCGMQSFVRRVFPELISGSNSRRRNKPHVLISRKKNIKEQNAYHDLLREYADRQEAEFGLFRTFIPDSPAVSSAVGKHHKTYVQKYPVPISRCFADFADEVKAVLQ